MLKGTRFMNPFLVFGCIMGKFKSIKHYFRHLVMPNNTMKCLSFMVLWLFMLLLSSALSSAFADSTDDPSRREYQRALFQHWVDEDGDCQNTRAELLIRQSEVPVEFATKKRCRVIKGLWFDFYTNQYFKLARSLDADHVVPLKEAWDSGADRWTSEKRRKFANDSRNLIAVSASANRSKGAKSPDKWMPDNEEYRCAYVLRWLEIKLTYGLRIPLEESSKLSWCLGD